MYLVPRPIASPFDYTPASYQDFNILSTLLAPNPPGCSGLGTLIPPQLSLLKHTVSDQSRTKVVKQHGNENLPLTRTAMHRKCKTSDASRNSACMAPDLAVVSSTRRHLPGEACTLTARYTIQCPFSLSAQRAKPGSGSKINRISTAHPWNIAAIGRPAVPHWPHQSIVWVSCCSS
jgi:hypothetical protein